MEFIHQVIQFIAHLDANLAILAKEYGIYIYALLFTIIFCETGLVVTAIMPGDSLLFATGVVAATGLLNIYWLLGLLITAAFLGNVVNYWIGKEIGHRLFRNKESKIFKQVYLEKTHAFYQKYGGKTLVIGRFLPIIRTFAPFVAGMSKMQYGKFIRYNFLGALLWVVLILYGAFLFGNIPFIKDNFALAILGIIILSLIPPILEIIRKR